MKTVKLGRDGNLPNLIFGEGGMGRMLVTGGARMIGSRLCERLVQEGHEVCCLDNLYTGNMANISQLLDRPGFRFLEHDVTQPLDVEVDAIYNLAAPASPIHYQRDPVRTTRTCVMGALNMLDLATRLDVPVLQASTSEVYGDPEVHPQPESYVGRVNAIGPRGCYDEGKRCAETLFFDYHRQYGTAIKVVRIFNTYGPGMHPNDGRVVSNFIGQALSGLPLSIYGDGSQTRSFCFVDDLVDGLLAMMNSDPSFTGPVNLGNPEEVTMRELAATVARLAKVSCDLSHQTLPRDDPARRRPDISLATQQLGWTPRVGLEEGLARTIASFRERLAVDGVRVKGDRSLA